MESSLAEIWTVRASEDSCASGSRQQMALDDALQIFRMAQHAAAILCFLFQQFDGDQKLHLDFQRIRGSLFENTLQKSLDFTVELEQRTLLTGLNRQLQFRVFYPKQIDQFLQRHSPLVTTSPDTRRISPEVFLRKRIRFMAAVRAMCSVSPTPDAAH